MPHRHCLSLTRGRTQFLVTVFLATVLLTVLTTPVSANGQKAYRASGSLVFKTDDASVSNSLGATIGTIQGNSYYSAGGSLQGRLEDRKLYNSSGSLLARFDGDSIYNAQGHLLGKLVNESLSDSHGATIGKIEGAAGPEDPATAFLAFLLLGVM
jgi:hypothetical protein